MIIIIVFIFMNQFMRSVVQMMVLMKVAANI